MKSMLHEASTVVKAIEKAWIDSGKPLEFTINIHEVGEKNFLGFTKRPAIVSITYDPRRQPNKALDKREAPASHHQRPSKPAPARHNVDHKLDSAPQQRQPSQQPQQKNQPVQKQRFSTSAPLIKPEPQVAPVAPIQEDFWTPELITDIGTWLKDSVKLLGDAIPFELNAEKRMLRVAFERSLLPSPEDERQLFIGLSYLLLQCLKKKHKKKLRGYHLIISSKHHATPENLPSH